MYVLHVCKWERFELENKYMKKWTNKKCTCKIKKDLQNSLALTKFVAINGHKKIQNTFVKRINVLYRATAQ